MPSQQQRRSTSWSAIQRSAALQDRQLRPQVFPLSVIFIRTQACPGLSLKVRRQRVLDDLVPVNVVVMDILDKRKEPQLVCPLSGCLAKFVKVSKGALCCYCGVLIRVSQRSRSICLPTRAQ